MRTDFLDLRALRIMQNTDVPLYLFALAAEDIERVADVARISRDQFGKLIGYQRPEKKQHVKQILVDCDADTLLVLVDQEGPACHTGTRSCFEHGEIGVKA